MDKKNISKRVAAILLSGVTLISSTGFTSKNDVPTYDIVALNSNQEQLKVFVGINLFLDDRVFVPTDVKGNIVEPFAINGTTYLPIRAIAEALNLNVNWNDVERTVELTSKQNGEKENNTPYRANKSLSEKNVTADKNIKIKINGKLEEPVDTNGKKVDIYAIDGTTYLPIRFISTILGVPIEYYAHSNSVFIGKHMIQIDPNNYSNKYQQQAQNCLNYAEIMLNQCRTDILIFRTQYDKISSIVDEINDIGLTEGDNSSCYKELEPIRLELLDLLYKLSQKIPFFEVKYYQYFEEEINKVDTSIESVDNLEKLNQFNALVSIGSDIALAGDKVRLLCTDDVINNYVNNIEIIMNKYQKRLNFNNYN